MSDDQHDQEDWSPDSAALFRDARRAHDPTTAELASIDAIYARIRSNGATLPTAMERTSVGVTPRWLRPLANRFVVIVLVAAGSFSIFRGLHQASGTTDQPASRAAPAPSGPAALEPAPTTWRAEPSESEPTPPSEAARPDDSRSRGRDKDKYKGRSPTNVASRRAMVRDKASVVDAHGTSANDAISATAPAADATRDDSPEMLAPAALPARVTDTAPRTAPTESDAQALPAARKPKPQPDRAPSELALLKRMHEALRASDFAAALSLCTQHERRWPHGTFELEREGVRVIASCGANSEDAAARAREFLEAHPHAALAMRVRTFCAAKSKF